MKYEIASSILLPKEDIEKLQKEIIKLLEENNLTISEALYLFDFILYELTNSMEISCDKIRKYD